jgi:hypothetical protein
MEDKQPAQRISLSRDWKPLKFGSSDEFSRSLRFSVDDMEALTGTNRDTWPMTVESVDGYTEHYGLHLYLRVRTPSETFLCSVSSVRATLEDHSITGKESRNITGSGDSKEDQLARLIKRVISALAEHHKKNTVDYYDLPDEARDDDAEVTALTSLEAVIAACQALRLVSDSCTDLKYLKIISRQLEMLVSNRTELLLLWRAAHCNYMAFRVRLFRDF